MDTRLRLLAGALGLMALAGCACGPKDGAVQVVVRYPSLIPGCLEVGVTETGGQGDTTRLVRTQLASRRVAIVGVSRAPGWSQDLALTVKAFEGACAGAPLETHQHQATVEPSRVSTWEVVLAAQDGDGDGFAPLDGGQGGTDCNDSNGQVHPAASENCLSGADLNCNGLTLCADPTCANQVCDDGNPCTLADTCTAGTCMGAPQTCEAPPVGGCYAPVGTCQTSDGGCEYTVRLAQPCDGGLCFSDGTCRQGEANCTNGIDDDGDGPADCADSDCRGQTCNDGVACTVNDRCATDGGVTCAGQQMVCDTPPGGPCWQDAGVCVGGGCFYAPATGRTCNDGSACTSSESCQPDAGCGGGTVTTCTPQTFCVASGSCNPSSGACDWTTRTPGTGCNDGVACTHSDACAADGGCAGTPYVCTDTECANAQCEGDGGCRYVPLGGNRSCDGGTCQAGVCVAALPDGGFGYTPSNFDPLVPTPSAAVVVNCAGVYDTSPDGGFVTGSCPAVKPSVSVVLGGSADEMVVLAMSGLTVTDAGSWTFRGSRPVILAVYGDAELHGPVRANSTTAGGQRLGPGGDRAACGAQAGADGGINSAASRGGGGGGGAYAHDGGSGGNGDNGGAPRGLGGVFLASTLEPLRGGCPGGPGGTNRSVGPQGGSGGGALQVSVSGQLRLDGILTASGMGGEGGDGSGGNLEEGGGGGGSGGLLVCEAGQLVVTANARLTANGGGGGGGAQGNAAQAGSDGSETSATPAPGGPNEGGGTAGGVGGAGSSPPGNSSSSGKGGGGGGGAAGRTYLRHASIVVACQADAGVMSPPPLRTNCP